MPERSTFMVVKPRRWSRRSRVLRSMKRAPKQPAAIRLFCGKLQPEHLLLFLTLLAVVLGCVLGIYLNPQMNGHRIVLDKRQLDYLRFPGEMFLRGLQMLILPLIISSNISSVTALNRRAIRWLAALSMLYFMATSVIAVLIGTILVLVIEPGTRRRHQETSNMTPKRDGRDVNLVDSVLDLLRSLIPDNVVKAAFQKDMITWNAKNVTVEPTNETSLAYVVALDRNPQDSKGTNILGLIVFSLLFGIAVRNLGPDAAVLAEMFHSIRRATLYLVSIVQWFSPIGIMFLIANSIAQEKELTKSVDMLYFYAGTVMAGLCVHGLIVLPLLLLLFARRNPLKFAGNMMQALVTAVGTASSTATLPCTIRCLEMCNIDPRVTRFMLPLGTTLNMDGTVMYEAIAVIYIAQRIGVELSVADILLVDLASVLAGTAAASMPSAGLITMAMVLMAVGLPSEMFYIIVPVDWFLDRFRTMINVLGDAVGAAIMARLCEKRLKEDVHVDDKNLQSVLPIANSTVVASFAGDVECTFESPVKRNSEIRVCNSSRETSCQCNGIVDSAVVYNSLESYKTDFTKVSKEATCVYVMDEDTVVLKF